jgi:phage gp46-like protein
MSDALQRAGEGCAPDPFLLFDSVWMSAAGSADYALAGPDEPLNRGGLAAKAALATAVTLALFTDIRVSPDHPLAFLAAGDPRGWWGDGADVRADLGESPLGSLLWLLERAPLTIRGQSAARWAEQFALEALLPLKQQAAVVRIEVSGSVNETANRLELSVALYGRDGGRVYDRKFDLVWNQIGR